MQLNQFDKPVYIISAFCWKYDYEENEKRKGRLKTALKLHGQSFSEITGTFDGVEEKVFFVVDPPRLLMSHLADVFEQESILLLMPYKDNMYEAIFVGGYDFTRAGYFRSVSKETIDRLGLDYTRDENGTYFSILPTDAVDEEEYNEVIEKLASSRGRV
jgi:hypothetical protein